MTREEIINGLKMSMDLTLFDPSTGEVMEPWQLNEVNRTAYEAYKGAIELLEEMPSVQSEQVAMIEEIRKWINSKNRGNADYFIVDKIEEIINKYE